MPATTVPLGRKPIWDNYSPARRWLFLAVLFLVSTSNYLDRAIISVLIEPIKKEFAVSDTMMGLLSGASFALFYATLGIPVARWADRGNRRTIIAAAVAVWSVMTAVCGMAQTFWQLALARIGVGAGEAGGIPPGQSLIADYFPPDRRTTALAIFSAAGTAGYLLGFILGAQIAATHGWRMAFIAVGLPGLLLAVIAQWVLREPRTLPGYETSRSEGEGFAPALAKLRGKRSYVLAVIGITLYSLVAFGALLFAPSYLVRVLGVPLTTASGVYGGLSAVGAIVGTLGGGMLADRLMRRDIRWLAWLPALACGLAAPLYIVAFTVPSMNAFLVAGLLAGILLSGGLPPVFAAVHTVCGGQRRAVAIALVLLCSNLIGMGLGPVMTGLISDALTPSLGASGLRWAIVAMCAVLLPVAWSFQRCGAAMPADLEA